MTFCGVCYFDFEVNDYIELAKHFLVNSEGNDSQHIKFLNRFIAKHKLSLQELAPALKEFHDIKEMGLGLWMKKVFVRMFYSAQPHPFILALQKPTRAVLLGYVIEHQHFLRQWVKSCAFILAKTDHKDVQLYEIENINTEFGGIPPDVPSHYEYLLRMGESLGLNRDFILNAKPLKATKAAIKFWNQIAQTRRWQEVMAAMHGLELIAYRNIKNYGAKMTYFDPQIFDSPEYTNETKHFLREGYEADIGHADEALALVEKYAKTDDLIERIQASFLQSIEYFDSYLFARLERSKEFVQE